MIKILRSRTLIFILAAAVIAATGLTAFAEEKAHERRIRLSAELVRDMAAQDDAASMADVIKSGKGVAIFPAVTKAGLMIGGQVGEGLVLLRNPNGTWNGPSFMGLSGASIGIQIGAQSVGLVLVITNEDGLRAFTGGNSFKLGADVAIAAGPVG
ncbi:MAG: lipid-binding SYLF domain-containing protein, partial [Synergistaceae bacterium]|nr:lipid-binding SYLF domain-containing protein [Synergistaceae bacterium]